MRRVKQAAILNGGKIYTGRRHSEIIGKKRWKLCKLVKQLA